MVEWWRLEGWPTAEEWQAVWALATVAVAVVAAVVALRQHRSAVRDQVEQGRPFVIMDLAFLGTTRVLVVISNTGKTGAYDIRCQWSTPPVAIDHLAQEAIDRTLVNGSIPFLAPGRSIRFVLNEYTEDASDYPRRYEVEAAYKGYDGRPWSSVSVLDVDQWAGASADHDPYEHIIRELKRLADANTHQREADQHVMRAAESMRVFLEGRPSVQAARQAAREERERAAREFDARHAGG